MGNKVAPATNHAHNQSRDPTGYLLLYVFAGPVIGTLTFALVSMFSAGHFLPIRQVPDLGLLAIFLVAVFLPGWFFGFIPALFCALILVTLRRYVRSDNLWLATTPFAGWLAVWLPLVLISGVKSPRT